MVRLGLCVPGVHFDKHVSFLLLLLADLIIVNHILRLPHMIVGSFSEGDSRSRFNFATGLRRDSLVNFEKFLEEAYLYNISSFLFARRLENCKSHVKYKLKI